jgi:N4-gp56 family major capsid protein
MATGGLNLASQYSKTVDERFFRESQAMLALNSDYKFSGVDTVKMYSIPVVPMTDYGRSGTNRYGTPKDLARNVQTMKITKDRSFTFIIDKGDKIQSQMVSDAGKALARQLREVCVPEFDSYVFRSLAASATAKGSYATTAVTKSNAYEMFLDGEEALGNANVPDLGRVAFCSYRFANLLKQDSAFMRYGDTTQQMLIKGVIGEVDGCKIVKVPASRLPAGCAFIMTHPSAATGPKQLEDYKIHDNPPGVSGWLVEGRFIYDCFVLNEKAKAVYYHGAQPVLKILNISTAATDSGKSTLIVEPGVMEGVKRYYMTADTAKDLTTVTYGTAITPANWTEMTANGLEIAPTATHTVVRVVEVDSDSKPIAAGDAVLNIG